MNSQQHNSTPANQTPLVSSDSDSSSETDTDLAHHFIVSQLENDNNFTHQFNNDDDDEDDLMLMLQQSESDGVLMSESSEMLMVAEQRSSSAEDSNILISHDDDELASNQLQHLALQSQHAPSPTPSSASSSFHALVFSDEERAQLAAPARAPLRSVDNTSATPTNSTTQIQPAPAARAEYLTDEQMDTIVNKTGALARKGMGEIAEAEEQGEEYRLKMSVQEESQAMAIADEEGRKAGQSQSWKGKGKEKQVDEPTRTGTQTQTTSSKRDIYQLLPIDNYAQLSREQLRLLIIARLEQLCESVLQQLVNNVHPPPPPSLPTPPRSQSPVEDNDDPEEVEAGPSQPQPPSSPSASKRRSTAKIKPEGLCIVLAQRRAGASKVQKIVFPRRGPSNFAALVRTIELVLECLRSNVVVTKRDLYYRDKAAFGSKQAKVDGIVDDLAATLGVRREDLNIVASPKGLCYGPISLVSKDGSKTLARSQAILIPASHTIDQIRLEEEISWVLIIEKDAVFQSLSSPQFVTSTLNAKLGHGILITGKGYPDVATRELLVRLKKILPERAPILALVDSDPHGIAIFMMYRIGVGSATANATSSSSASPPIELGLGDRLNLLGVKISELSEYNIDKRQLLKLGDGDRKRALGLLSRCGNEEQDQEWRFELEYMLHSNSKAEIEIFPSTTVPSSPSQSQHSQPQPQPQPQQQQQQISPLFRYVTQKIKSQLDRHQIQPQPQAQSNQASTSSS